MKPEEKALQDKLAGETRRLMRNIINLNNSIQPYRDEQKALAYENMTLGEIRKSLAAEVEQLRDLSEKDKADLFGVHANIQTQQKKIKEELDVIKQVRSEAFTDRMLAAKALKKAKAVRDEYEKKLRKLLAQQIALESFEHSKSIEAARLTQLRQSTEKANKKVELLTASVLRREANIEDAQSDLEERLKAYSKKQRELKAEMEKFRQDKNAYIASLGKRKHK